ncbi:MAG TPA: hypothetical protein VEK79_08985 [Thermoanaerobaculia bacterium]|nr:hypothetical protein [Thermoanaerobaculia bacterium]
MRHLVRWMVLVFALVAFTGQALANCDNFNAVTPANGATNVPIDQNGTVMLEWSAQVAAGDYDVYFGPIGSGCTAAPHATVNASFTEWAPPSNEIAPGGQYEWKVIAKNGGLTGCPAPPGPPQTPCSTFTVAAASCPASGPTLTAPANNSTVPFGTITLDWDAVANATSYEIFASLDGDPFFSGGSTTLTQKQISIEPGRTLEWKVVANAPSCTGMASAHFIFTTNCPTSPANQNTPAQGATFAQGQNITFSWSGVAGATSYDLEISDNDGSSFSAIVENHTLLSFTTNALAEGDYFWRVRANFDGDCDPLYSSTRELAVGADCGNHAAPTLIFPAANATESAPVRFHWSPVLDAARYEVYVQHEDDQSFRLLGTTTDTEFTSSNLTSGVNAWRVHAVFDDCPDTQSPARIVNIEGGDDECPANPGKATLVSPAANAGNLSSPVTFKWNAVPGAIGYRVMAAFGTNASPESLGITTNTELTADVPAGTGYWLVQTFFGERCPATLSDRRTLTVTNGANCNTGTPQLLSPANGATSVDSPVEFKWSAVQRATGYQLFVASGDDDFSFYGETTLTTLERLVPAGIVRWFVRAQFAACPDANSAIRTFIVQAPQECATASINLLAPANGATTSSPVHMSWSAVAGAQFYRVWVSIDGDAPVNILRLTTTQADINLPAGNVKWYVDAPRENCPAVVSGQGSFTVAQAASCSTNVAPTLVSPAGTRENPATAVDPVTLTWNAVPNAIGYRVWISTDFVSFEDIALTKQTQYQVTLGPDVYAWFTQALFAGCDELDSNVAFFRINETTPRCPSTAPVIIAPGAGETATSPVAIAWTAVAGAEKYRVFASIDESEPQLIGVTDETELTRALPPGDVVVAVEAVFEECPSRISQRVAFRIERSGNCTTTGAELVSPANGSTNVENPVDFVWNPVSGAVRYVLFAQVNDGTPTAIASTEETQFTRAMPPGVITWHVLTFLSGCDPVESARFRFTIARDQACNNRKPILLLPADGSSVPSPVHFQWTPVPNAIKYLVWARRGDEDPGIVASTTDSDADVDLPEGTYEYFVQAYFDSACEPSESARGEFEVTAPVPCGKPGKPEARVVGQALSNTTYRLRWTPQANVQFYEVQESTTPDFANATTFTTANPVLAFVHEVNNAPLQYLYRVRAISDCSEDRGPYSDIVGVLVVPPRTSNASTEIGTEGDVVQKVFLPGSTTPLQFTATADKPWITITPSAGTLPVEGTTLTITADPKVLNLGTNTATIRVTYTGGSARGGYETHAGTLSTIPMSISLVTPVVPSGKGTPPPDSLIFPVVGHASGANDSLFESDIRITNLLADTARYELHYTPSNSDGTQTGSSSTIEIAPGSTMALDDVVATLFGVGTGTGTLEVRPLTTSASALPGFFGSTETASLIRELATAASSRTYNFTPSGTFGQFIPAVRFEDFVGKALAGDAPTILSLQQVAQSNEYRANFGFSEAAGEPVDLAVRVYDTASTLLATIPISLQAGEHRQLNGLLVTNGITNLADGRVEVEVVNGNGKVTAYVSEVDNKTNDPLLVSAVKKGAITANKYVVPGVAYLNNPGAFWVTDMRIFNAGSTATPATLTFYPERNPAGAITRDITLQPGEIEVLNNVLVNTFGVSSNMGGAVAVTTPANTQLTATARTYNQTTNGTYGQYIPGVTPAESVGVEDRALQLLQLEQSSRFRTNIGVNETAGQPVTIEVSAIVPDLLVTPVITINLQPNEFQQISLLNFGVGSSLYNARVTVKVISGTGRVTAYASAIDAITQDPTYVPAQ